MCHYVQIGEGNARRQRASEPARSSWNTRGRCCRRPLSLWTFLQSTTNLILQSMKSPRVLQPLFLRTNFRNEKRITWPAPCRFHPPRASVDERKFCSLQVSFLQTRQWDSWFLVPGPGTGRSSQRQAQKCSKAKTCSAAAWIGVSDTLRIPENLTGR
jgi:hypothetical protein